jgi:hypothetical protein
MKFFIYIVFLAFLVIIAALYRNREGFDTNSTTNTTTPSKVDLSSVLNIVSSVITSQGGSNEPSVVDPLASTNWNPTIPRVNSTLHPQPKQPLYTLPNIPYISNITCPTCQPSSTPAPTKPKPAPTKPKPAPTTHMPKSGCPYSTPPNFTSALPNGVSLDQIPDCFKDKYILKTEIVPPVCPACPACNAYPAPTTPLATTPQRTCSCSNSTPVPSTIVTPSTTSTPTPTISNIALNTNPNPNLQGMNTSQGENPSYPSQKDHSNQSQKDPYYQSQMNSNYGTSFDNYPFQTPMRQTNYSQDMPPLNPFVYNTSSQNDSPWPMPILNNFSKFGS